MAQTGFTPIQLYSTSTAAAAPVAGNLTNSTLGSELAINITDGKLFYKDNANAVQVIGWKTVPTTAGGTGLTTYTAGDLSYYASGTTFTKLAIGTNGQILTSTGSAPQWTTLSGVAVTTFSAGTTGFTPNSATSGAITLAGTLITSNGGTGLSSYTAGDLSYYASGTALTKLAIGASGRFLSSTGSAPQWSAPAALTETDDTNVTMTLGGTPSTALLSSVSMTLGWTGTLAISRGGTGTGTAFTAGSVVFAGASGVYSQDNANYFWDNTNKRLGVGTNTPARGLSVRVSAASDIPGLFVSAAANSYIGFADSGTTDQTGLSVRIGTSGNNFDIQAGGTTTRLRVHSSGGVSIGNTTDPGATNLSVTGKVLVNTSTATGAQMDITGGACLFLTSTGASNSLIIDKNNTGGTLINFTYLGVQKGSISTDGTNTFYNTSSDQRLKENITLSSSALPIIDNLKICSFDWKQSGKHQQFGTIAQELYEAYPEAVYKSENEQDMMGVDYSKLVPLLIKAIQELRQQFNDYVATHP
jgi:hypothetical protein